MVRRIFFEAENRRRNEVRGDTYPRVEKCVGKELVGARTEELYLPDNGRFLQENGPGLEPGNQTHGPVPRDWAYSDGRAVGSSSLGPNMGLKEMDKGFEVEGLERAGPTAPQEKARFLGRFISRKGSISEEPLMIWVPEELRREQRDAGFSMTDRALEEEAQRKRREKIHIKELLEKSKFERELKRLECSVNYEGGSKQKGDVGGYCEKSRHGEIYRLESLKCGGAAGGILICLDKRVLDILDWEEGHFTLSCRFKTIENGAYWVFTGVYGPFTKVEREGMWEEFGAIRGLLGRPLVSWWGFQYHSVSTRKEQPRRISSAMRRFAETVDDLELWICLFRGKVHLEWGLNNQAWARLDKFLVSPSG
ncbi:hypothetical protein CK203_110851 [Vitis vinifera]|uniref:DUF4283 domain-containing protein n=1 Tax=Vitis vinifera TaxID=29760 RepID=A0A438C9F7_VITVI|nr:hypothetical protein CK203_110851 [Vitis vinifera]